MLGLVLAGAAAVAAGGAALGMRVLAYLERSLPIDSDAGLVVFRVGDGFASYRPFEVGVEPWLIGAGLGMLAASAFLAAALRRPGMG